MPVITEPLRADHSTGHTDLCYEDDGKHILTCGTDGDIRIWKDMVDDDPESIKVGEVAHALAFKNGRLYTASDSNTVQAHTYPEGGPDGILTRFTAPATHFCISEDGTKMAAGSSDFTINVVDIEDTNNVSKFKGHTAPILSVALDPQLEYLASAGCDGALKVWELAESDVWLKSISVIPKCSDVSLSKTLCRIAWQPKTGKLLAVPLEKEVQVFERDNFDVTFTLTPPEEVSGVGSVAAWSPCGKFLATSHNSVICVWDIATKKCIEQIKHCKGQTFCGLAWHPRGNNEIAYTDIMGHVGTTENPIPDGYKAADTKTETKPALQVNPADLFDDYAEDDGDLLDAVTQAEGQSSNRAGNDDGDDMDDDDMDDDDMDDDMLIPTQHRRIMQLQDENSNDGSSKAGDGGGDDGASSLGGLDDVLRPPQPVYQGPKFAKLQPAFIAGSTPAHLSSRFMKWNAFGIVRCYNDNDDESSIDVEFHDTSIHHALHFDNPLGHTMADLSNEAVVLACEGMDDSPSQLMCYHFASWDTKKEWTTVMPKGENIKALTAGSGWVAVATDKRLVRLFTVSGVQKEMFALPGPVVCMAAHGKQLMVIYHAGTGFPGDQYFGVKLINVVGKKRHVMSDQGLPISPKSTLTWIGFSVEGTPVTVDTEGVVRLLNRSLMSWTQVAHTRAHAKGRSDHYWVTGVNESAKQLRCIPCKGSSFPPTLPRPAPIVLPFELPFCEMETEKGKLEEAYWKTDLLNQHCEHAASLGYEVDDMNKAQAERQKQDSIMKLFALACKTDREYRASEICRLMTSEHAVGLAIKYASRSRRLQLATRLSKLAQEMMEAEEEEEEEEEIETYSSETTFGYNRPKLRQQQEEEEEDEQEEEDAEQVEVEEDEDMEDEDDLPDMQSSKRRNPFVTLKPKPDPIPKSILPNSQPTRRNPFKKSSESADSITSPPASGKGSKVFDNLKKISPGAKKAVDKSSSIKPSNVSVGKKGKQQATLFGSKGKQQSLLNGHADKEIPKSKPIENGHAEKEVVKPKQDGGEVNKKPPSAFQFWLSKNRSMLQEENPELDDGDIVKAAAQKWRTVSAEDKKDWSEQAKQSVEVAENDEIESSSQEGKKRKRDEDDEDDENRTTGLEKRPKSQESKTKNNEEDAMKKKPLASATNAKLAGFAFSKKD
ncbi:WD repeat and HMG-box DNA-binding protein 1-like [Amphiura filiformis]|uniref:WD repeat and HMG-box DNA-binding protein 1-like n=1 Tax=Amphiura filiformis TaxID=82378 RepID=UPI003B220029